jgi:hypothetical protein
MRMAVGSRDTEAAMRAALGSGACDKLLCIAKVIVIK